MKRNPNHMSPQKADILSRLIMTENKFEAAMGEFYASAYYKNLPMRSSAAVIDYILNDVQHNDLPGYEFAEFNRKCGHLQRWHSTWKNLSERLAKL